MHGRQSRRIFSGGVTEAIGRVVQQLEKKESAQFHQPLLHVLEAGLFYMQQNALHITASGSKDSFFLFHNFQSITSRGYINGKPNPDKQVTESWTIPRDGKASSPQKILLFLQYRVKSLTVPRWVRLISGCG
jgi:hypothetical protein